jgi:selenide,water dikinase
MLEHGAHACTDVTGFGLLGHSLEMADAGGVSLRIRMADVPLFEESLVLIRKGIGTRMTRCNLKLAEGRIRISGHLPEECLTLLADPQTSGGLLVALPAEGADALVAALREAGDPRAARIGEVFAATPPSLEILS